MGLLKIRNAADDGWIEIGGFATLPGYVNRPKFEYKDANEVTVGPGQYHHAGTTTQMVYWTSGLDITVSATGADWDYLYIDDSAVVTAGTSLLTASELIFSTTEPIWSDAKMGWYNGNDRCIFAVYCTGAATQAEWRHHGEQCQFDANINAHTLADVDTTWTDVTMTIPAFCRRANATFEYYASSQSSFGWWRTNGSSGVGHLCVRGSATVTGSCVNNIDVLTDSSGKIEIKMNAAGNGQIGVDTCGWYFGEGM
jgi:hypothetical protein